MLKRLIAMFFLLGISATVAACGDTWEGAKEDTSENLKATGNAIK